jgi:hypothetical protein
VYGSRGKSREPIPSNTFAFAQLVEYLWTVEQRLLEHVLKQQPLRQWAENAKKHVRGTQLTLSCPPFIITRSTSTPLLYYLNDYNRTLVTCTLLHHSQIDPCQQRLSTEPLSTPSTPSLNSSSVCLFPTLRNNSMSAPSSSAIITFISRSSGYSWGVTGPKCGRNQNVLSGLNFVNCVA